VFRPCIDLHEGRVKQIVGGSLEDPGGPHTNFEADHDAAWFARRYRDDGLAGGHVIMLGPGNEAAAAGALAAYPGGLQVGGGVTADNATGWLDRGASHVIVTSWLFPAGRLDGDRLAALVRTVGRDRLVLDLSCRRIDDRYVVMTDRWRTVTDTVLDRPGLAALAGNCAELLVHAVDVEGLQQGMDDELVARLAEWSPVPCTYAGGARTLDDLHRVDALSGGRVHLTIGSALDLFGGTGVRYADVVAFNRARPADRPAR
jgi:phosphoribosylformimino-5-aminoimidazole carboxamide ribotide isomerase